jgi:hypothetical protein
MSLVYFIQNERGHVKIGFTRGSAHGRLRTLQTASAEQLDLISVVVGGEPTERELHKRFAARRIKGEWFDFSNGLGELCSVIDTMQAAEISDGVSISGSASRYLVQCKQWVDLCITYRQSYLSETLEQAIAGLARDLKVGTGKIQNVTRQRVTSVDADFFHDLRDLRQRYCEQELEQLESEFNLVLDARTESETPSVAATQDARAALEAARTGLARMRASR